MSECAIGAPEHPIDASLTIKFTAALESERANVLCRRALGSDDADTHTRGSPVCPPEKEVPALRGTSESGTSAGPSAYREAVIAEAALRYDEGHRPVLELPHGRADFGTDELRAAIGGDER